MTGEVRIRTLDIEAAATCIIEWRMYTPFVGPKPHDPEPPKQLSVIWRMQGPRSIVVAALYEHPVGRELRVFFEDSEDNVLHTQVGAVNALEAKAAQLRAVLLEQGWLPIEHKLPPVS